MTGYYLLGFEPAPGERDGQPHEISIEVKRRGVEVRARRVFAVDAESLSTRTAEQLLGESLRLPLLSTEVPVRVATYSLPDVAGETIRILITAGFGVPNEEAPVTAVAYRVSDPDGKLISGRADAVPVGAGTDQRYLGTVVVDPGVYTLKLAAVDADGRVGSVEHQFKANLNSTGSLRYGDLVLIDPLPGVEGALRPLINPTVAGDTLLAYLEVWASNTAPPSGLTAELQVAADANAPAILSVPLGLESGGTTRHRRVAQGTVSLAALPPGPYVARTTLLVNGKPVARLVREFEFNPSAELRARGTSAVSAGTMPGSRTPFDRDAVLTAPVLEHFLQPLGLTSGPSATVVQQALARVQQGEPGDLTEVVAERDATDAATAVVRGVGLYARGQLERAADAFRRALRFDSESSAAAFYLGACYAAGGRDREAVGAWQTTLASDEEAPFIYGLATDAYLRLRDVEAAADLAEEAYQRWPEDRATRLRFARTASLTGQRGPALQALDAHLAKEPRDPEALILGMRLVYETVADGKSIENAAQDRARFDRYLAMYRAAGGPDLALAERWRDALWGTRPAPKH
jgi:tetratricopeptide (TPR) repeat protein